jgi:hypothetical protein
MDGGGQGSTVYDVIDLGFDPAVARRAVAATNNVSLAVLWRLKLRQAQIVSKTHFASSMDLEEFLLKQA